MIDYERVKREGPKLKAMLTRAKNVSEPQARWQATLKACKFAVQTWESWGAWPDAWATWQIALDDAYWKLQRMPSISRVLDVPFHPVRLEEL